MFLFLPIVCGQYTFQSNVKGYETIVCQCHNCGNISGHVIKSRPFFTLCFVPIVPYTISGFTEVVCHICNFKQPLQNRPDVVAVAGGHQGFNNDACTACKRMPTYDANLNSQLPALAILSIRLSQTPNFTPEEHVYIYGRLPVRQPRTALTAINHFRRLPFLYQDLAEASRVRLSDLPPNGDGREREKRQRIAILAQRLADRYHTLRMVLPRSYMEEAISRWQGEPRASRFWEKILEEIEKANNSWSIVRPWILLFIIQSTLVTLAMRLLSTPAQMVLLAANGLGYIWSATVMRDMLHARYTEVKTDEQELHDLIGGLRP